MDEAQLLQDVVTELLTNAKPEEGFPADLWSVAVDAGWPLIGVPEEAGGAGGDLRLWTIVLRGLGRHGLSLPALEAHLAAWVCGAAGSDSSLDAGRWGTIAETSSLRVGPRDGIMEATGCVRGVPWARYASYIVIYPTDSPEALLVRRDDVSVHPEANLADEPRDTVVFQDTPTVALANAPAWENVRGQALIGNVSLLVGAVEGAYELTRYYVGLRHQFGRPLIRFQVVAHRLAQLAGITQSACEALGIALDAAANYQKDLPAEIMLMAAKLSVVEAATNVASGAHQLHGAIGITREHILHRFTRRLWSWRDEWGTEREWATRLGRSVGMAESSLWTAVTSTPTEYPSQL